MDSEQIFNLAVAGKALSDSLRIRLIPLHLFQLAQAGKLKLTQGEKDRLTSSQLTELAMGGVIKLSERDLAKLDDSQKQLIAQSQKNG